MQLLRDRIDSRRKQERTDGLLQIASVARVENRHLTCSVRAHIYSRIVATKTTDRCRQFMSTRAKDHPLYTVPGAAALVCIACRAHIITSASTTKFRVELLKAMVCKTKNGRSSGAQCNHSRTETTRLFVLAGLCTRSRPVAARSWGQAEAIISLSFNFELLNSTIGQNEVAVSYEACGKAAFR